MAAAEGWGDVGGSLATRRGFLAANGHTCVPPPAFVTTSPHGDAAPYVDSVRPPLSAAALSRRSQPPLSAAAALKRASQTRLTNAPHKRASQTHLTNAPHKRASQTRLSNAPLKRASQTRLTNAPLERALADGRRRWSVAADLLLNRVALDRRGNLTRPFSAAARERDRTRRA